MKKIMFAVPQHAAEFIESANLEAEGITKLAPILHNNCFE